MGNDEYLPNPANKKGDKMQEITVKLTIDEKGRIVKVTDAAGKRLDNHVEFKTEVETKFEHFSTFKMGTTCCMLIDGTWFLGPHLC